VKLFEQMLEWGAVRDAHLIHKAVSNKFFQLVAEVLDDKRLQADGLRFLDIIRAHGIDPSLHAQNRLLAAWKNQPPASVIEYLLKMKSAGVILSKWAYRCIVVRHERSDPEFALKIYSEMERSGIQLSQAAYNSVLRARLQLGMHNEARDLFMQMADQGVVPNGKTYGIMVRGYSSIEQFENAIALFETMREQSLEPDWHAYHHAIRSCITLQRVEYAVELYNDAVQAKVPLCTSTYVLLSGACKGVGWDCLASKLVTELTSKQTARMKEAEAAHATQA
jgi:pentatricopeptide repeat protein